MSEKVEDLSIQEVYNRLKALYGDDLTLYQWKEDGKSYRSWKIRTDGLTMNTGDGGAIELLKAFDKSVKEKLHSIPGLGAPLSPKGWAGLGYKRYDYSKLDLDTITSAIKEFQNGKDGNN